MQYKYLKAVSFRGLTREDLVELFALASETLPVRLDGDAVSQCLTNHNLDDMPAIVISTIADGTEYEEDFIPEIFFTARLYSYKTVVEALNIALEYEYCEFKIRITQHNGYFSVDFEFALLEVSNESALGAFVEAQEEFLGSVVSTWLAGPATWEVVEYKPNSNDDYPEIFPEIFDDISDEELLGASTLAKLRKISE